MNSMTNNGAAAQSFMERVKTQYEAFMQKVNLADVNWKEIGSYMVVGFVAGFLTKRYLRGVILIGIIVVVALKGLEYYHLIEINWEHVQSLAGVTGVDGMKGIFETTLALIRNNLTIAISSIIGFVVGYKIG